MITVIVVSLLSAYPAAALAQEKSSSQLIDRAGEYDGQELVYSGEVIGDILHAGDHVWLNVSDGSNALGVWVRYDLASMAELPGRYGQRGDIIRVSGTFYRACPEHGGDMDLHADAVTLIERGYPVGHAVPLWKVWLAALLTIAASALLAGVIVRFKRRPASAYRP